MKRKICILLSVILCVAVFLPTNAYAETYNLGDTDMSISIDDTMWYVFTRDNIENNPELDELGLSYDTMHDILYSNKAYVDAILYYEDGDYIELFVRKAASDISAVNLSDYDDETVLEVAEELADDQGAEEYSVYKNSYKFAKLEYIDTLYDSDYHICEFLTVVNKEIYTLTFQASFPYTEWEYEEIENIVDSIIFDIDTSIKEDVPFRIDFKKALVAGVFGGIAGGLGAAVRILKNKKKKDSGENN